jgi:uncharacterized damage-inducible protein DinB
MGKADELARKFEESNQQFINAVEGCSDEKWRSEASGEDKRSVGTVAHHVATSHMQVVGLAQAVGSGVQVPPLTMDMIEQGNAQHARQNPSPAKDEVLSMLRADGEKAAGIIRSMTDDQLSKTAKLPLSEDPVTTAQIIEMIAIGHPAMHMQSITG